MGVISAGQITIIDLYDAPVLNAWISASQTTVQTYNNTTQTWSPSYASTAQVLTLNLTKAGSSTSLLGANVTNIKWEKRIGTTTTEITATSGTEFKGGTSNSVLTTKNNTPIENNAVVWTASGTWNDPITGLGVDFAATIDLTVVQLAKAAVIMTMYAPDGDTFRNDTPTSITINADLYKDGALSSGSKKIKWFAADASVGTSQDADAGAGWRKITSTTTTHDEYVNTGFDIATNGQGTVTVKPVKVINAQTYLAVITDNAGGTAGTKVKGYLTLRDMDDPVMVVVESTAGTILKNGSGSTSLTARLFRQGSEIDPGGTLYTYRWYKYKKDGTMHTGWGGGSIDYKPGKTLEVSHTDVDVKSVFKVEVIE